MIIPTPDALKPRAYEPLSVRAGSIELRTAHALEAIAGALCRMDQRLADDQARQMKTR